MNVGRKKPIRPSPRCMDKLRSDLKEHKVDPKLTQKMEELKSNNNDRPRTRRTPDWDKIGKGAACLCKNMFMSIQERLPFLTAVLW